MCDDRCAINLTIQDGRITEVVGLKGHPWNDGKLCVKGKAVKEFAYAPDRLTKPLKKVNHQWKEVSLEEALDEIAYKLNKIKAKYGARSLSVWKGEAVGFEQQESLVRRFCHAIGTPNYFSSDSACFCSRYIGFSMVYGSLLIPDYENAKCIVIWGANPIYSHPFAFEKIVKAKRNGAKVIVIDPRKSEVAKFADVHIAIKPGTDGALAWGIIKCLIDNKLYDESFIKEYTIGFDEVKEYARKFTFPIVEQQTSVSKNKVQQIASWMTENAPKTICYAGNGLEHHENGVENARTIAFIPAILGCIDNKGGNRIGDDYPLRELALYDEIPLGHLKPIGSEQFPVLYDKRKECHSMSGIDTILSGKPYPIKGMVLTAANPALTNPNASKVGEALSSLELLVVRDLFMTKTAEYAHFFLPAASFLGRNELHVNETYNIINTSRKVLSIPGCQDEYSFWHDLADRMGAGRYFPWENETALNRWLLEPSGISLEEIERNPQGYLFKPVTYEKWKEKPFQTESGKIEFTSNYLEDLGYHRLPLYEKPSHLRKKSLEYPFTMISGSRKKYFCHSRYHNISAFNRADPYPYIGIQKKDAKELHINAGDWVKVSNNFGFIDIQAEIIENDDILPGYVLIPHGWSTPNVNIITPDDRFDPISGFPILKAVPVSIVKL